MLPSRIRKHLLVAMIPFNYRAEAELFFAKRKSSRSRPMEYRRFSQAAQAVRFAIEEVQPELLLGAYLEVDETRYDRDGIRLLYDSAEYPLSRRAAVAA
jgi:hypothetical protein